MSFLTPAQVIRIEKKHVLGITSADIISYFAKHDVSLTEASLRKYVQLGLLPKSRRVPLGPHRRGSAGHYPIGVVRILNEVKRALSTGGSLKDLQSLDARLTTDIVALEDEAFRLVGRVKASLVGRASGSRRHRQLESSRRALSQACDALRAAIGDGGK